MKRKIYEKILHNTEQKKKRHDVRSFESIHVYEMKLLRRIPGYEKEEAAGKDLFQGTIGQAPRGCVCERKSARARERERARERAVHGAREQASERARAHMLEQERERASLLGSARLTESKSARA